MIQGGDQMPLTPKQQEILDEYFRINCKSKVQAVKNLYPAMKRPDNYANKVFRNPDFKEELYKRRAELLMESMTDMSLVVKALAKEFYGSLGLIDRTIHAHNVKKGGFDTAFGKYSDSADAKNYWGIMRDILGPEVSTVLAMEDIKESKNYALREESFKLEKQKIKLENEKLKRENKPVQETNITDVRKKHGL